MNSFFVAVAFVCVSASECAPVIDESRIHETHAQCMAYNEQAIKDAGLAPTTSVSLACVELARPKQRGIEG